MRCNEEPILNPMNSGDGVYLWCASCGFEENLGFRATVADAADMQIQHSIRERVAAEPHPALTQLQEKYELPNRPAQLRNVKSEYRWI